MKIVKVTNSIFILIIFLMISTSNCSREDTLVARVGTKKITLIEFEDEFAKGKSTELIKKSSLDDKEKFLDGMINRQLKIINAYQNNLDTTKKIIDQVNDRSRGIMFNRLIELEVIQKVMPESEIKDYYQKANREVKIKQIMVKFDPNISEQKQMALNRAKEIVQRLKDRESFEKLAIDLSDDINTAKKGGDKGFLKWGPTSSENPLYVAAFSMKENEISDPIETPNGYYIIKVVNIKKYQIPPYEQQRERIRRQMYSIKNKIIEQKYYEYMDMLRKKYQLLFTDESIEMFATKYLSPGKNTPGNELENVDSLQKEINPLDSFTDTEKKSVVASFYNGSLSIGDLVGELKRYPPHRRPIFRNKQDIQNFINSRLVPIYLLEQEVKKQNINKDNFVVNQVKNFRENIMINEMQRIQINEKLNITDEDIQNYFEQHREEYKNPEKREIQQIFVADKGLADDIVRKARRGVDFDRLFRIYNQKESLKENDGKFEITEGRAGIGKPSFRIKRGQVADPIKIGNGYFIIKVLNIIEPTLKTFEESKNLILPKIRRVAYEKREKEWFEELRNQTNFVVYEKNLSKSFTSYSGQQYVAYE